jgi:hypothetical protein
MQKYLKIAGFIALVILVSYFGIMAMLTGMGNKSYNTLSVESGAGMGIFQTAAPSMKSAPMFSGESARDSAATIEQALSPSSVVQPIDKKIIKTGDLSLKVERAETAAESITNIAKVNKGEVAGSNFYESTRGVKSGFITVRVPYNNFDAAFAEIKKVATQVVSESSNSQDITEQYIDLEARLKNKQAEEVSFAALLNRAGKLEEIISVTRELARVRGEIEQLQGQLRYLNSQTDMSTITASLSEDVEIAAASQDWRPWQVIKLSVKQLITAGQNFVDGLIAFLIVVLPMLIIYGLIIWALYLIGKKIYNRTKGL